MSIKMFPAHVYHLHHEGFKEVANQEEFDALGPGWCFDRNKATLEKAFKDAQATIGPPAPPEQTEAEAKAEQEAEAAKLREEAEKTSLYSAPVTELLKALDKAPTDVLERVQRYESENPSGARVTLMKALEKLIALRKEEASAKS